MDEHDKLFDKLAAEPKGEHTIIKGKSAGDYQEQGSAIKFSSEELTDGKVMSGTKGRGVTLQSVEVETSKTIHMTGMGCWSR